MARKKLSDGVVSGSIRRCRRNPSSSASTSAPAQAGLRMVVLPLFLAVVSMMSVTMQHFVDRIFLTWWSAEAVAGVTTGGFAIYVLTGLFNGTAEYATPFVSQYVGARREDRIGAVVYQAAYFAILAGLAGWGVAVGVAGPVANQLLQPAVHGVGFGIHHFGLLGGWGLAIQSAWGSIPSITVWRPERKVVAVGAAALHGLRK